MNNCLSQNVQIFQNYILVTRLTTHFGLEKSVVYEELLQFEPKNPDKIQSFVTSPSLVFCTKLF